MYSKLSNKRDGWNKRDGRKILQNIGPKIHSPPNNFKLEVYFWNSLVISKMAIAFYSEFDLN